MLKIPRAEHVRNDEFLWIKETKKRLLLRIWKISGTQISGLSLDNLKLARRIEGRGSIRKYRENDLKILR